MARQTASVAQQFQQIRAQTLALCAQLDPEDMVVQSMPDASPTKWHLAHTTWFFEAVILQAHQPNYCAFDDAFGYLFNSYYESVGKRHARDQRGLLTRPTVNRIVDYRRAVDDAVMRLLDGDNAEVNALVMVGLHHEMQHQELLLTDILHLMSHNPCHPVILNPESEQVKTGIEAGLPHPFQPQSMAMCSMSGGLVDVGAERLGFSYDCERPQHKTYLQPHALGSRLVTNAEWLAFINDKAYQQPLLWLSDGWTKVKQLGWQAPLYWLQRDDQWFQYGLDGLQPVDMASPVCHISYYEAEAFARWAGKRLPTEHELEHSAQSSAVQGNFVETRFYRPRPASNLAAAGPKQLFGDVWEWTQSAYAPYPKFEPEQGVLGEYNGKFMANQFVLKGGSCATPAQQMRASYRNFFYPFHRWQFTGVRLAEDR